MNVISRTLLDAEQAMNDNGAHWVQSAMCRVLDTATLEELTANERWDYGPDSSVIVEKALKRDPRTCGFCAVGAIRFTIFGTHEPDYYSKVDESEGALYLDTLLALGDSPIVNKYYENRYRSTGRYLDDAEGAVIDWNDNKTTSWDDVNTAFRQAAIAAEPSRLKRMVLRIRLRTFS